MLAITCSSCQKKLSVKDDRAGKKVKCPGCGHVTVVATQPAGVKVSNEDTRTMAPASKLDGPALAPKPADASNAPTNPFLSKPDATQGVKPSLEVGHDASLTDFLAPPQADDELGRLGEFRILKILGHGGMGVVFLGEDSTLGRKVAIKAMLPHLAGSKSSQQRFLREARAAATLEHDHIVAIHHVGVDRGAPYIVMPFLKGEPLDERLRRDEKIPLAETLRIGREIAAALAAAHAMGFVHRDIKPANVWLESRGVVSGGASSGENSASHHDHSHTTHHALGRVKILDFGLARAVAVESELTQQGAVVGTPAYMAPEQARGESVDARCDVWSLGVVLYRMCAGEMPFKGANALATLRALEMNDPPPPAQVNAEIPAELSGLVMKLLAKNPADRVNSAAEVVQALQAIEELIRKKESREPTIALAVPVTRKLSNDQVLFAVDDPPRASSKTLPVAPAPKPTAPPASNTAPPRRRAVALIAIALFAVLGALLLGVGIVYYFQTDNGVVRVEINDPKIKVVIEGNDFTFTNVDNKEIRMKPGKHGLSITRDDFTFNTTSFELRRGDTVTLSITLLQSGKLLVLQGNQKIGEAELAKVKTPPIPAPSPHALAFDGQDSHVKVPTFLYDGKTSLTLETWALLERPASSNTVEFLLGPLGGGFGIGNGWENPQAGVGQLGGLKWNFSLSVKEKKDYLRVAEKQPLPRLQWIHIAGVYAKGQEMRFYVDGKLQGKTPAEGTYIFTRHPLTLGHHAKKEYFQGRMTEVRLSKVARYDGDSFTPARRHEPDADTLALYHFDEGSGDVLKDSSGKGHDGEIVGAKWVKVEGTAISSPSVPRFALRYDGKAKVEVPNLVLPKQGPLCMEAYVTLSAPAPSDNNAILLGSVNQFHLFMNTKEVGLFLREVKTSRKAATPNLLPLGKRFHIAGVKSDTDIRLYVDGKLAAKSPNPERNLHVAEAMMTIGFAPFDGILEEVRISKATRYDKDFTPAQRFEPDKDTIALYHFDEGAGDLLKDSSGNNHHGKIVGAKWVNAEGTAIAKAPGPWQPLLDAKLTRWIVKNEEKTIAVTEIDKEPVLQFTKKSSGNLSTKETLQDYHLRLEIQFPAKDGILECNWVRGPSVFNLRFLQNGQVKVGIAAGAGNRGDLERGAIVSNGPLTNGMVLANADLKPSGEWNRLDLVRLGGTIAIFLNGRFVGAATDLRWLNDGKEIDFGRVSPANFFGFGVLVRRIEVRDIGALPPELLAPPAAIGPFDANKQEYQQLWANHLGRPVEEANSVGMKLRLIPPGDGVAKPFYLGKYEVTQGEWEKVMDYNPSRFGPNNVEVVAAGLDTSKFPVELVSWYDGVEYCNRLSDRDGLKPYYELKVKKRGGKDGKQIEEAAVKILGGSGYHIPTDAEWEHGCRAGTKTIFHCGNEEEELLEYAWFDKNSEGRTHTVGEKKPNAFGLNDMHGNVREWNEEMLVNAKTGASEHVTRAGSWANPAAHGAVSQRLRSPSATRSIIIGLRVARAADGSASAAIPPLTPEEIAAKKLQDDTATKLKLPVEATNKIGMKLRLIPPGAGAAKAFYLGKYEVTQGEWENVMGYNPSGYGPKNPKLKGMDTSKFPVDTVNWFESVEFCHRLSVREGLKPYYQVTFTKRSGTQIDGADVKILGGSGYHLPTDAEWEHGCWAGTKTKFHCGDKDEDLLEYAWFDKNSEGRTHEVGAKKPNAFGLYDMHGNVAEWTAEMLTNAKTGAPERNLRGGYWNMPGLHCGVSWPTRLDPAARIIHLRAGVGLRVARAADGSASVSLPPLDPAWLKAVAAMKPEQQIEAVKAELMIRNPGFDGVLVREIKGDVVTKLVFATENVSDIAPVRALSGLRDLGCEAGQRKGRLVDLAPLKDMTLDVLRIGGIAVSDLSPLAGTPLRTLYCFETQVSDLAPLKNTKLISLWCHRSKVADLTPLKGLPLQSLSCDFVPERDSAILGSIKTLKTINGKSAAEFWQEVDSKKLDKTP